MYITAKFFYIVVGLLLSSARTVPAQDDFVPSKGEKTNSLDIMEMIERRVDDLEDEFEKRNNKSEELEDKVNMLESLDNTDNLTDLNMRLNILEEQVNNLKEIIFAWNETTIRIWGKEIPDIAIHE